MKYGRSVPFNKIKNTFSKKKDDLRVKPLAMAIKPITTPIDIPINPNTMINKK